jgi:hypothetical protein
MDPARTLHSYDLYGSTVRLSLILRYPKLPAVAYLQLDAITQDTWSTIAQKNQDLLRPLIICKLNEVRYTCPFCFLF